jgi:hypothetical protein
MRTCLLKSSLKTASVNAASALALSGCATTPLETSGSLASYDGLAPASGMLKRSKLKVDKANVFGGNERDHCADVLLRRSFQDHPLRARRGMLALLELWP